MTASTLAPLAPADWLAGLGRKVEVDDMTADLLAAAEAYLAGYTGDFAFLTDLKRRGRALSPAQGKGVLNCWRAEVLRAARRAAERAVDADPAPEVAAGHYAVASATGNNDLDFFRVDRPTEGRWAGRTFVKRVIGGHPEYAVRGEAAREALARIAADPDAGPRYGREIGRCCRCNRRLTDEVSRAAGIGPDCAGR